MDAELILKCDVITDYDEAKKQKSKGKRVWSVYLVKDKGFFSEQLLKKDDTVYGYVIMDKDNTEIILSRREIWKKK